MSKYLAESLEQLNEAKKAFNEVMNQANKALDIGFKGALGSVDSNDAMALQKNVIELQKLLKKATKGENIDNEVKEFSKQFEQKDK